MTDTTDRPRIALVLLVLVALTGLGAILAGVGLLADPSGADLGMSTELLAGVFADFTIPGLFLLLILGLGAAIPAWGLRTVRPWGPAAALGYGVVLLAWITVQALIIGIVSPLQPVFGTVGLLICAFALALPRLPREAGA
jgi:hypothetical protein